MAEDCLRRLEVFERGHGDLSRDLEWQLCQQAVLKMLESL